MRLRLWKVSCITSYFKSMIVYRVAFTTWGRCIVLQLDHQLVGWFVGFICHLLLGKFLPKSLNQLWSLVRYYTLMYLRNQYKQIHISSALSPGFRIRSLYPMQRAETPPKKGVLRIKFNCSSWQDSCPEALRSVEYSFNVIISRFSLIETCGTLSYDWFTVYDG